MLLVVFIIVFINTHLQYASTHTKETNIVKQMSLSSRAGYTFSPLYTLINQLKMLVTKSEVS